MTAHPTNLRVEIKPFDQLRRELDREVDLMETRFAKNRANRCATGLSSSTEPLRVSSLRASIPFAGEL